MVTKLYFETYGCSLNFADTDIMKSYIFESDEFEIVEDIKKASIVIINSCSVKSPTEKKILFRVNKFLKENKKVLLCGCIAQAQSEIFQVDKYKDKKLSVLGTEQLGSIVDILSLMIKDKYTINVNKNPSITKNYNYKKPNENNKKNSIIDIVPISRGCLGNCNYCITKIARGHLNSYKIELIKKRIEKSLENNIKEIWLTSEDLFCFGQDNNENIIQLLNEILSIKKEFKIRLGMTNPNHLLRYIDEFLEILKKDSRIFRFIHIPIQSGNNRILKEMNRFYSKNDFLKVVKKLRDFDNDFSIATDVICGYPSETEEEFEETVELIREIKPEILNISRFWKRPKTKAQELKCDIKLAKQFATYLYNEFKIIANKRDEKWLHKKTTILIDEIGKNNSIIGRNDYYRQVVVDLDNDKNSSLKKFQKQELIGKKIIVNITNKKNHYLIGVVHKS